ncbi:MAG: VWA domain-containing protein [Bacteroidales bacterium]|nr:VWA domain-containing protein [Bacteroidales bacterium]
MSKIIIPRSFDQLFIFLLDCGDSMYEYSCIKLSKRKTAQKELISFLCLLNKNEWIAINNSYAIVNFYNKSNIHVDISQSVCFNDDLELFKYFYNPKNITEGLTIAEELAVRHLANKEYGIHKSVVIVLLSDGCGISEQDTIPIINRLKSNKQITIASCFFETLGGDRDGMNEAANFLKKVCSSELTFWVNSLHERLIFEMDYDRPNRHRKL